MLKKYMYVELKGEPLQKLQCLKERVIINLHTNTAFTHLVFYNLNGRITPVKNLNARASDGDVPVSQSYLVPAFHVFHEVFGLVIANTFPRRRFHTLQVIYAKLNIKMIRKDTGRDTY
jgi:hypothetical protein